MNTLHYNVHHQLAVIEIDGKTILTGDLNANALHSSYDAGEAGQYALSRSELFNTVGKAPGKENIAGANANLTELLKQKLSLLKEQGTLGDYLARKGFAQETTTPTLLPGLERAISSAVTSEPVQIINKAIPGEIQEIAQKLFS